MGWSLSDFSGWNAFFGLAVPAWRRCGETDSESQAVICAEYGGQDILVYHLSRSTNAPPDASTDASLVYWGVDTPEWWQKR